VVVLTDPTTGGVLASYAMLGDVHIAEPGATIGFSGRRVIEQTIRETLPPGFQTSEFLVERGMVDRVAARSEIPTILGSVRKTHRAVVVEAGAGFAGMGSELSAVITEQAFDDLDAPVERVTGVPAPMPYARNLEKLKTPTKERIIEAVRRVTYAGGHDGSR